VKKPLFVVESSFWQGHPFGQGPNAFIGIELRSVSRKVLEVQARVSLEELSQRFTVVSGGVVEQDGDETSEVRQQFAEKPAHLFLADVVEVKQIVEAQTLSLGTHRDAGDDRDFGSASLAMTQQGSAALGRPSLGHQGSQQEARLIGKN
jgi:hypothetical protein